VPRARLVERDGTTFKIAEFVDGTLLRDLSGKKLTAAHAELRKHFASDALLGSWDVIGLGDDNIIVDKAGKVWRIDNGGSLLFRAQGAPKPLGNFLDELWTMRDANIGRSAAEVFDGIDYADIAEQLSGIVSKRRDILGRIADPNLRGIMDRRIAHAEDLVRIYKTFHDDQYINAYIDRFSYHNTWVQSSGIMDTASKQLRYDGPLGRRAWIELVDENGKEFDDLRGDNGIYAKFLSELGNRTDGKSDMFIQHWAQAQAGSSWSAESRYVKAMIERSRPGQYYSRRVASAADADMAILRARVSEDTVLDATAALNALSYETLRRVEVGNRPAGKHLLRLIRTESKDVLDTYGLTSVGDVGRVTRGAAESVSLLNPVVVEGSHVTEQDVPLHRVLGFYGFGTDKTMYYNDRENELVVILDGLDVVYRGRTR